MESIIKQGKKLCPFLRRTSPATMRMMATKSSSCSGHGSAGLSGLQQAALKCPVMSKHMGKAGAGGSISSHQSSSHGNGMSLNVSAGRSYVTASPVAQIHQTCRNAAELASLEDVHRTAGVTDLSRGKCNKGQKGSKF